MIQEHENDHTPDQSTGTAEEEQKKIVEDKAAIHEQQEQTTENRPDDSASASDSSGVNAEHEEPIDPRMPVMPPA